MSTVIIMVFSLGLTVCMHMFVCECSGVVGIVLSEEIPLPESEKQMEGGYRWVANNSKSLFPREDFKRCTIHTTQTECMECVCVTIATITVNPFSTNNTKKQQVIKTHH